MSLALQVTDFKSTADVLSNEAKLYDHLYTVTLTRVIYVHVLDESN